jgi:CRP-like cAMP-binding protein
MNRRPSSRHETHQRIKAAEDRLLRLRKIIERRVRAGLDTAESWRLFNLTSTALANIRQSENLIEALNATAGQTLGSASHELATVLNGANPIVFNPGQPIEATDPSLPVCYLIQSGLVSFCFGDAQGVEVGAVGPGEIVGISNFLPADTMPVTPVTITECQALTVPAQELAAYVASNRKALMFIHAAIAQQWAEAVVIARCNAEHSVRQRVSRWVLRSARRLAGAAIAPISHDRLASLLGVRRASVTVAIEELEGQHAIISKRNAIEVREQSALEALSCDCHLIVTGPTRLPPPRSAPLPSPICSGSRAEYPSKD